MILWTYLCSATLWLSLIVGLIEKMIIQAVVKYLREAEHNMVGQCDRPRAVSGLTRYINTS